MGKLGLSLFCTLLVSVFQNCAREQQSYATDAITNNSGDPEKVHVSPAVLPSPDSVVSNSIPLSVSEEVEPFAVDFGANPNYDPSTALMSWGWWIYNWKQAGGLDTSYLGAPEYLYRLDLFKFAVIELTTRKVVYTLNPNQIAQINALLTSSTLSNVTLSAAANEACASASQTVYASLETDYGNFDLTAGACASVDLTTAGGQSSGLSGFLAGLNVSN